MRSTCQYCGDLVEESENTRGRGKLVRHRCPHGRLCIGASVHRKKPSWWERTRYCEACADRRL